MRNHSDPIDGAALGDLYKLGGRDRDAEKEYPAVERLSQQSPLHAALYNRHLALFLSDHNLKADKAYALARKGYETRRDVYGADALAWAALKAGKLDEAQAAMKDAMHFRGRWRSNLWDRPQGSDIGPIGHIGPIGPIS